MEKDWTLIRLKKDLNDKIKDLSYSEKMSKTKLIEKLLLEYVEKKTAGNPQ